MDFKEYGLILNSIQMLNFQVIKSKVELYSPVYASSEQKFSMKYRHTGVSKDLDSYSTTVFVKIELDIYDVSTKNKVLNAEVEIAGLFKPFDKSSSTDVFNEEMFLADIDKVAVPLMLPSVKANLLIMSSMMNIPPIIVPSVDILHSIKANDSDY